MPRDTATTSPQVSYRNPSSDGRIGVAPILDGEMPRDDSDPATVRPAWPMPGPPMPPPAPMCCGSERSLVCPGRQAKRVRGPDAPQVSWD